MKKLIVNDYKVFDALKENPNQTRENIASELKINKRTVQRCLEKSVTYDYVIRDGSKNRLLGSLKEKIAFFEMAKLSKTRDFHPSLPYNIDKGHLSPYRYEVGWVFILMVDLFPIQVMACFLPVYRYLAHFCNKKRGFPAFLRSRKSINFYRFSVFFSRFSYSATPPSQHVPFPHEIHDYGAEVDYGIDMSTDV